MTRAAEARRQASAAGAGRQKGAEGQDADFLSPQSFENLTDSRKTLTANESLKTLGSPMDVFVPWAGSALESSRGIYYLGAGLDAEENHSDNSATFEAALEATEQFVRGGIRGRRHSPFWNFLDDLTTD
jgi:hypothetical protein